MPAPRHVHPNYAGMDFPRYEYKSYPRMVHRDGLPSVRVRTPDEHLDKFPEDFAEVQKKLAIRATAQGSADANERERAKAALRDEIEAELRAKIAAEGAAKTTPPAETKAPEGKPAPTALAPEKK